MKSRQKCLVQSKCSNMFTVVPIHGIAPAVDGGVGRLVAWAVALDALET